MNPTEPDRHVLQVVDHRGRGLRLTWSYAGDRYGHEIAYVSEAGVVVCLVAQLGCDGDPWPSSPPVQQVSLVSPPRGGRAALLLGMAGRSHWSQSVEGVEGVEGALCVVFDIACRAAERPVWLGNAYRTRLPVEIPSPTAARVAVASGVRLTLNAVAECALAGATDHPEQFAPRAGEPDVASAGGPASRGASGGDAADECGAAGRGLAIAAAVPDAIRFPATVRWKFQIGIDAAQAARSLAIADETPLSERVECGASI